MYLPWYYLIEVTQKIVCVTESFFLGKRGPKPGIERHACHLSHLLPLHAHTAICSFELAAIASSWMPCAFCSAPATRTTLIQGKHVTGIFFFAWRSLSDVIG